MKLAIYFLYTAGGFKYVVLGDKAIREALAKGSEAKVFELEPELQIGSSETIYVFRHHRNEKKALLVYGIYRGALEPDAGRPGSFIGFALVTDARLPCRVLKLGGYLSKIVGAFANFAVVNNRISSKIISGSAINDWIENSADGDGIYILGQLLSKLNAKAFENAADEAAAFGSPDKGTVERLIHTNQPLDEPYDLLCDTKAPTSFYLRLSDHATSPLLKGAFKIEQLPPPANRLNADAGVLDHTEPVSSHFLIAKSGRRPAAASTKGTATEAVSKRARLMAKLPRLAIGLVTLEIFLTCIVIYLIADLTREMKSPNSDVRRTNIESPRTNSKDSVRQDMTEILSLESSEDAPMDAKRSYEMLAKAVEIILGTGQIATDQAVAQKLVSTYYNVKDYPKAIGWASRYLDAGGRDAHILKMAAESAGPGKANDPAMRSRALEKLATLYPSKETWADLIENAEKDARLTEKLKLDLLRLRLITNTLTSSDNYKDFVSLAADSGQASEAKAVLELGAKNGALDADALHKAQDRIKQAPSSAPEAGAIVPDANLSKDGTALVINGYDRVANGQYEKGVSLIEEGLKKGNLREPGADMLAGIAFCQAAAQPTNDSARKLALKNKAIVSFQAVRGSDGAVDIARLWMILARQQ